MGLGSLKQDGQTGIRDKFRSGCSQRRHSSGKARLNSPADKLCKPDNSRFGVRIGYKMAVRVVRLGKTHPH